MSETLPEGVSRKDFDELRTAVTDLAAAFKQREEAETAREQQAAREEVAEKRADLDALAKEMGVSPAKLREAAENAKRDEEKERLRPLLMELLDEEIEKPDDEPKTDDEKPDEDKPVEEEPKPKPPEDSAPIAEHWSERSVGSLLK